MFFLTLQRVFHGIRLLRLIRIDCRETINFFMSLFEREQLKSLRQRI